MAQPATRRERLRAETLREIQVTARKMLVADGFDGLALRAIAREIGMSAPALYRYYASREDLIAGLVDGLKEELADAVETGRDDAADQDVTGRMLAACRAFREWAVQHPAEFTLIFASRAMGLDRDPRFKPSHGGDRFGQVFGALLTQLYLERPFPIPADDEIDGPLRTELEAWCSSFPVPLPIGVSQVFLSCWIRLYGTVSMEVFGQLTFALSDASPMFEVELRSLAAMLNVTDAYRPPS